MRGSELNRSLVDLAWSLWTELGVPGVLRRHRRIAVDIEPLLLFTPHLLPLEPRLREQTYAWCVAHHRRVSASRLRGLVNRTPASLLPAWARFCATLRTFDSVSWPADEGEPWIERPSADPPHLSSARPSLARLRARWICGVGVKADVVCELLGSGTRGRSATQLAVDLGYTPRQTRQVVSELLLAGVVAAGDESHSRVFRLREPSLWRAMLTAEGVVFPRWGPLSRLVGIALSLTAEPGRSPLVRRVDAHKRRDDLAGIATSLALPPIPETAGRTDAHELVVAWLVERVGELADGTSAAFL